MNTKFEPRILYLLATVACMIGVVSCKLTTKHEDTREENRLDQGWRQANIYWQPEPYPPLRIALSQVPGAEYVHEDVLCRVCHKTHVEAFQYNVHRQHYCEDCHGPASRHLETRGKQPGMIRNFKQMKRAERAEVCATCHEHSLCDPAGQWRTSAHAHHGVDCLSCHAKVHYHLAEGTPKVNVEELAQLPDVENWKQLVAQIRSLRTLDGQQLAANPAANSGSSRPPAAVPEMSRQLPKRLEAFDSLVPNGPAVQQLPPNSVSPNTEEQIPTDPQRQSAWPGSATDAVALVTNQLISRETPPGDAATVEQLAGTQLASQAADPAKLPSLRGTSNNLGAVTPVVCYNCHTQMQELETIAHPHQINGQYGFNCNTCHDVHGNVLASSRKELCLQCHQGTPTTAWHSSIHEQVGVACTDCHNPHPDSTVQPAVNIRHASIRRPPRLPMSVYEPYACYKCHPKVQAEVQLPSHHPIVEGKMVCSVCHDPHGQNEGNLREVTVNLLCYRCHADKQGPFVYQHPPVEEDCGICHSPHGTVANNLLRQPPTFLCLRCHAGHRAAPSEHFGIGTSDIDGNPGLRPVYYTDCTNCHSQVHGSDLPSQNRPGALLR